MKDKIIKLIRELFADSSRSQEETKADLGEIYTECDVCIDCLESDEDEE